MPQAEGLIRRCSLCLLRLCCLSQGLRFRLRPSIYGSCSCRSNPIPEFFAYLGRVIQRLYIYISALALHINYDCLYFVCCQRNRWRIYNCHLVFKTIHNVCPWVCQRFNQIISRCVWFSCCLFPFLCPFNCPRTHCKREFVSPYTVIWTSASAPFIPYAVAGVASPFTPVYSLSSFRGDFYLAACLLFPAGHLCYGAANPHEYSHYHD